MFNAPIQLLAALMLALLALGSAPAAAQKPDGPKGPFVAALRAQNAQYLKGKEETSERTMPATIERDWEDKLTRKNWTLREGPLKVEVTLVKGGPPDGMLYMKPKVTLYADGKQAIEAVGVESIPDNPIFLVQIAELDPSNPYKEVVFSTFTGGAHCCTEVRILTSSKDGKTWTMVEGGTFDGGPFGATDLDGDGRLELAMRDNAFLYAFGCYACSTAPLQVLQLDGGEIKNVSDRPEYRQQHVRALRHMIEWADESVDRNGFLAGYVGEKIRLSEGAQAWKFMLEYYDRETDWGLDFCAVNVSNGSECPENKKQKLMFPEALERFLMENGYKLKK